MYRYIAIVSRYFFIPAFVCSCCFISCFVRSGFFFAFLFIYFFIFAGASDESRSESSYLIENQFRESFCIGARTPLTSFGKLTVCIYSQQPIKKTLPTLLSENHFWESFAWALKLRSFPLVLNTHICAKLLKIFFPQQIGVSAYNSPFFLIT